MEKDAAGQEDVGRGTTLPPSALRSALLLLALLFLLFAARFDLFLRFSQHPDVVFSVLQEVFRRNPVA